MALHDGHLPRKTCRVTLLRNFYHSNFSFVLQHLLDRCEQVPPRQSAGRFAPSPRISDMQVYHCADSVAHEGLGS